MALLSQTWQVAVLAMVLVVAAVTDLRTGKIPNALTYSAVVVALIGHTLTAGLVAETDETGLGLTGSVLGMLVGFGPLYVAWRLGAIGGGDAKLMGAIGALGGVTFAITALFYSCAVAVVMAVILMIRQRIVRRTARRIGTFVLTLLWRGKPTDPAGPDSPTLAFGLALCLGSAVAATELILRGRWLFYD